MVKEGFYVSTKHLLYHWHHLRCTQSIASMGKNIADHCFQLLFTENAYAYCTKKGIAAATPFFMTSP